MCGIALTYNPDPNRNLESAPVALMLDEISHRGQDQININHFETCVVGFRRLAITGNDAYQPAQYGSWVVYMNGEVYNYTELGSRGSECQVIARGLELEGLDFVKKLNGMFFILAIQLGEEPNVYVIRDRYGIKPVYHAHINGDYVFASEAKAIAAHPEYKFGVNHSAKQQWFVFQNVLTDETLYSGIYKFPKGSYMNLRTGEITKYWSWKFEPDNTIDFETAKRRIRFLVYQSVQRRIPASVKYCACISGGIDSNAIASQLPENTAAITVGFNENGIPHAVDERDLSKLSLLKTSMELVFDSEIPENSLGKTIAALDDLRGGASWAHYLLFETVKHNGYTVVFDGAGGDELFGGYSWRYNLEKDYYNIINRGSFDSDNLDYCKKLLASIGEFKTLEERYAFDAEYFLEGVLLCVDRLSMANTLEVRLPFLDNDLVDYALKLPNDFKKDKLILREAFSDVLHPNILQGRKKGFSTPDWIDNSKQLPSFKWSAKAYSLWQHLHGQ